MLPKQIRSLQYSGADQLVPGILQFSRPGNTVSRGFANMVQDLDIWSNSAELCNSSWMAIFYLVSQAKHKAKRELKSFSIERPQANEEIPLGENQSWMIEGNLPVREADDHFQKPITIQVEVFKLPNREAVAQKGKPRGSV